MQSPNVAESELKELNKEWVAAFLSGDTATLDRIMADDCTFNYTLEGDSKQQFIADIESGELKAEEMTRENVEVRIYGQTAVLTGLDTAKWRYKGHEIEGYYRTIHVYARRDERWQIVTVQSCPIGNK